MDWKEYSHSWYINRYQNYFKDSDKNDYMVDVGASIGVTGLPVAALGYNVIGFDPVPKNISILTERIRNCGFEDRFIVVPLALSNKSGESKIYIPRGREDNSSLRLEAAVKLGLEVDIIGVKTTRFDTWRRNKKQYPVKNAKLLKIDAHGCEYNVLQGAAGFLKQAKQYKKLVLDISFHPSIMEKGDGLRILTFLDELGYTIHVPVLGMAYDTLGVLKKSQFEGFNIGDIDITARCD